MYVFCPRRTSVSPRRSTEVARLCELVPASGSVIANAIFVVPAAMPRSQRSFCASVPWRAMMLPTIAAAPLLGQVHTEVALLREGVPELGRRLVGGVLLAGVVLREAVADAAHRLADLALLLRGHQRQRGFGGDRHARIMPACASVSSSPTGPGSLRRSRSRSRARPTAPGSTRCGWPRRGARMRCRCWATSAP